MQNGQPFTHFLELGQLCLTSFHVRADLLACLVRKQDLLLIYLDQLAVKFACLFGGFRGCIRQQHHICSRASGAALW